MLPFTSVRVVSSTIRPNERNREMPCFTIGVSVAPPPGASEGTRSTTWTVEKRWTDVTAVDAAVRSKNGRSQVRKLASLPDKSLFKDNAPSRVEQRREAVQRYLQSLVVVPLNDKAEVCAFFLSDLKLDNAAPVSNPAFKSGYLTKKGRAFGGWQTRWYVLNGPVLAWFETVPTMHSWTS